MTSSSVSAATGLTRAQVAERIAAGLVNDVPAAPSRTVTQIIRANVFTAFNALMVPLLIVVLVVGEIRDALFGGVILANMLIGVIQELRAKRTLDALAVLSQPEVYLVRDGEVLTSDIAHIVMDEVVELRSGSQVPADGVIVQTDNLEVDESLLTGESDAVAPAVGERVMSGSFVVAGSARMQVDRIGADAYAAQLAEQARKFTLANSELRDGVSKIISIISIALLPVGLALFWSQYRGDHDWTEAVVKTIGGVVAMVPEGLVLLVSVAFAVGVVRLARHRTLVQELPAIETLARVDVVCLDKTGTITQGIMDVYAVEPLDADPDHIEAVLGALAALDPHPNPTQQALRDRFNDHQGWEPTVVVPFSSARKWSGAGFVEHGSWIVGAPEMVLREAQLEAIKSRIERHAAVGRRVLLLAEVDGEMGEDAAGRCEPMALVLIEDRLRPDAADTLEYFAREGVTLKVISGDNPVTVGSVAARVGLRGSDRLMDARHLPEDMDELAATMDEVTVFGRVTPVQKRAMVEALQSRGHVVAMTGDGVNDVLALKNADVGIAMASGSEASRAVAQLVLLDSNFNGLPEVVVEGRKVINNLQRVSVLFLTKTTWALVIALVVALTQVEYPFLPRHLTIVSTGIIGIPSFLLALAPNTERIRGSFVTTVLRKAVPSGLMIAAAVLATYLYTRAKEMPSGQQQTSAALVLIALSLVVLLLTARPLVMWKAVMVGAVGTAVTSAMLLPAGREFFELSLPDVATWVVVAVVSAIGAAALVFWAVMVDGRLDRGR